MYGKKLVENIDLDYYYYLSGLVSGARFHTRGQQENSNERQPIVADLAPKGMESTSRVRYLREEDVPRFMNGNRAKRENEITSETVDQIHGELLVE